MSMPMMACYYDSEQNFGMDIPTTIVNQADVADIFMNNLATGDSLTATLMLSPEMQQLFPVDLFVFGIHGEIVSFSTLERAEADGFHITTISATHTKGEAVHQIVVDKTGAIAGFNTLSFAFEPRLPSETDTFTSEAVTIGEDWQLDGLLTLPHGASADNPVPAVILVHGSGSHNMDQSIFENRAFADIAEYLGNNGIAVLRYNQRSFSHGERFAPIFTETPTIEFEAVEDALLAAELLQGDPRISKIFVLGHSLGGLIAPRIAEYAQLDGAIMMAALTRPHYLNSFDQNIVTINTMLEAGIITQEEVPAIMEMIYSLLEEAHTSHHWTDEELVGREIFGFPATYSRSLTRSLPIPFILASNRPILALQGDRDPQTTVEGDFQFLLDYTQGLPHVTTHLYEGLNHMMMTSLFPTGPLVMNPIAEFSVPNRVDTRVTRDIVEWINDIIN